MLVLSIDIRHCSSTPYCGIRLNFLVGSYIWNIYSMQFPSFLETSGSYLFFFRSPIVGVKGLVNVLPSSFLSILIIILAKNLKLVPCVIVCCASKG